MLRPARRRRHDHAGVNDAVHVKWLTFSTSQEGQHKDCGEPGE